MLIQGWYVHACVPWTQHKQHSSIHAVTCYDTILATHILKQYNSPEWSWQKHELAQLWPYLKVTNHSNVSDLTESAFCTVHWYAHSCSKHYQRQHQGVWLMELLASHTVMYLILSDIAFLLLTVISVLSSLSLSYPCFDVNNAVLYSFSGML